MADPITLRNFRDSYVSLAKPERNFNSLSRLKIQSNLFYTYLYFAQTAPPGTVLSQAKLRVWNSEAWPGAVAIDVRLLASPWGGSTVNYTNKPAVGGPTASSSTVSNAPAMTLWEIDILPLMSLVQAGTAWYGLRLATTSSTLRNFFSSQAENSDYRPEVILQWSDAPEPPDGLAPDNNRSVGLAKPVLSYVFSDVAGDTSLGSHQVQLGTASDFGSGITFDSGWVATSDPYFDLSTSAYAGLAAGASIYWRVRVRDGAGVQSEWSDAAQFTYTTKGTLTSTSLGGPDGSGNLFVQDTTPPIIWSLAGRTQQAYRVMIYDRANPDVMLFDTGKITSTVSSIDTGPKAVVKNRTARYHLIIRVWDTIARETTPGSPLAYTYEQDFVYAPSATVTSPVMASVSPAYPYPWADIAFTRTTPPDSFTIFRDDEVVESNLDPGALSTGGTGYSYRDRGPAPRIPHSWRVVANVNGVDSDYSNSITATLKPSVTWMMNLDTTSPICLAKSADQPTSVVDAQSQSAQTVHQPIGQGASAVLVTQYVSGFEGHVDAVLSDGIVPGLTARDMKSRFKNWKRNPGTEVLLFMVDEVLQVVPYNMTYRPRAKSGGIVIYDVSFDFFQVNF